MKRLLFLLSITILIISGCSHGSIKDINYALQRGNLDIAVKRLDRCIKWSRKDKELCEKISQNAEEKNIPIRQYLASLWEQKKREEQRNSENPWDQLSVAIAISNGKLEPISSNEFDMLIKKAFLGFGECAKAANTNCMVQYSRMIMEGISGLSDDKKNVAVDKAIYWLDLAARYGNEDARKDLMTLERSIPSPDLSMEKLQKDMIYQKQREVMAIQQQTTAINRASIQTAMQSFISKSMSCTSNSYGSTTFTTCY